VKNLLIRGARTVSLLIIFPLEGLGLPWPRRDAAAPSSGLRPFPPHRVLIRDVVEIKKRTGQRSHSRLLPFVEICGRPEHALVRLGLVSRAAVDGVKAVMRG